ncbi:MAG: GNAT family N-acetyltransferase [Asgard group archaeon]|nr:GNAT family N-acetyltransferase [Asgard group archaeon]
MILFPPNEKNKLVKNMQQTQKEYEKLARCFNSFKDSDSWPGGFGGSFVFTAEWAEDYYKSVDMSSFFVVYAPDDENKMVGVCICNKSWDTPDGWYVAIIGVDPAYQGQKLGKALLLKATQYAMERGARFIGLHTWGGNLKAMPLYKRQGYKWRPRTSVYMENYIPQILNYSLFREFFSIYSWYDIFKPVINQEQNNELDNEMHIYEYYFETEEGESLRVWIDRSIGRISGFHFKFKNLDLHIQAKTPNSQAFVGIDEFPFNLLLKNQSEENVKISLSASSTSSLKFSGDKQATIELLTNQQKELTYTGSFLSDTEELDVQIFPQIYSLNELVFQLSLNGVSFPIALGKIPKNAVDIQTDPKNFISKSNTEVTLPVIISNFLEEEREIIITVADSKLLYFEKKNYNIKLSKYDSQIDIPVKIKESSTNVDYFEIKVSSIDKTEIISKKLPIIIFKKNKAISYEIDQQVFIENRDVRASYYKGYSIGENLVTIRDKKRNLERTGFTMVLGYPFDTEGSEFYTKNLDHSINITEDGIWLHSSASSTEKKGIQFTRKIFVPNDDEPIGLCFTLDNNSDKEMGDLGVQTEFWWWRGDRLEQLIFHFKEGIKYFNLPELPIDDPNKPEDFQEGWNAGKYPEGYVGCLYNLDRLDKIKFQSTEEKIPKLRVNESYETSMIWFYFADTWQEIQLKWKEKYLNLAEKRLELWRSPSDYKAIGLYSDSTLKYLCRGIILPKSNQNVVLSIDTQKETGFEGSIGLNFPKLNISPEEYIINKTKTSKLEVLFNFDKLTKRLYSGKLLFKTLSLNYEYPIAICCFDEGTEISVQEVIEGSKKTFIVDNGFLHFKADSSFRGQVYHLSVENNDNYLQTFYPNVKPFLWWNEFYGGLSGEIYSAPQRDEYNYNRLKFEGSKIQRGYWKGISFKSEIIEYSSKLKGLQVINNYLTLPTSPIVLFQQIVENHSETNRTFSIFSDAQMKTSGKPEDEYYTEVKEKITTFKLSDFQAYARRHQDYDVKWAAYKNIENDYTFGTVAYSNQKYVNVGTYSPDLSFATLGSDTKNIIVKPKEKFVFNTLYILTKDLESIRPFTQTNFEEYF